MAFELYPTSTGFQNTAPAPDIAGAIARRRALELQAQEQARLAEQDRLNRAERQREFNLRAQEWGGQDTAITPSGELDPVATMRNREARMAREAMLAEQGVQSVIQPKRVSDEFLGPYPGQKPMETPELPPTEEQAKSAAYYAARMKTGEELRKQAAELEKTRAMFQGRQGLQASRMEASDVQRAARELMQYDPTYVPQPYMDRTGNVIPEVANEILTRYSEIAPGIATQKRLPVQARMAAMSDEELTNEGFTPDQITAMRARSAPVREQQANQFVESVEKSLPENRKLSEAERNELRSKFIGGGANAVNAPAEVVKAVNSENVQSQRLEDVNRRIGEFNNKYGAGAFDEFVGPIDSPKFQLTKRISPPKDLGEMKREAADIFRNASAVIQDYRKANFGTAFTATEREQFRNIISDPSFADYADSLKSFEKSLKNAVSTRLKDYELAPNIPRTIKERFKTEPAPAGGKKVGRFIIETE